MILGSILLTTLIVSLISLVGIFFVRMKEEFRDVVDKVIQYCKEKNYISQDVSYDIDSIAEEIIKGQDTL